MPTSSIVESKTIAPSFPCLFIGDCKRKMDPVSSPEMSGTMERNCSGRKIPLKHFFQSRFWKNQWKSQKIKKLLRTCILDFLLCISWKLRFSAFRICMTRHSAFFSHIFVVRERCAYVNRHKRSAWYKGRHEYKKHSRVDKIQNQGSVNKVRKRESGR